MKYDVIVIGGGIAGVTASIYLKRAMKKVLLIESKQIGGEILKADKVENYPALKEVKGYELGLNMSEQLKSLDIEVINELVTSIDGSDNNFIINNKYECKKVIIATGTSSNRLGLLNEDKFIGKGISFCATCDGNFFKGKDVAVIGGGNTALDSAIYLSNIVNKVYLIHRRDEFRGEESKVNIINNKDNIEVLFNTTVKELKGNDFIESIVLNNDQEINVSGVFVCIGHVPNSSIFNGSKDEGKYIITDSNYETSIEGIYAIGDVIVKEVRQLTTAASDGTIAATNILKKL
ncbi:MAG: FAD-dependent oxidoreductase [Bacilli bacterium]|nr:FAD-dependent oxidoreductase [Bacilli bacterium]